MLAELLNVPNTPEELEKWSFAHQDQHLKINNAIFRSGGQQLALYILDPMPGFQSASIGTWAYQHQSAHTEFDGILKLPGNDFTSVDFTKPDQVASWIRLHFTDHFLAQEALGFQD